MELEILRKMIHRFSSIEPSTLVINDLHTSELIEILDSKVSSKVKELESCINLLEKKNCKLKEQLVKELVYYSAILPQTIICYKMGKVGGAMMHFFPEVIDLIDKNVIYVGSKLDDIDISSLLTLQTEQRVCIKKDLYSVVLVRDLACISRFVAKSEILFDRFRDLWIWIQQQKVENE